MHPLVVSHRTNAGTSPENTLAGIEHAIRDGAHAIEVDVRGTRDGGPVLMHDATLQRTCGDPRAVEELTLAELRDVRVFDPHGRLPPQPIPTLTEAIETIAGRCAIEIDFPAPGIEAEVAGVVRRLGAQRWTWFTTHPPDSAEVLRRACPRSTVLLSVHVQPRWVRDLADAIRVAGSLGLHGINPSHRVLSAPVVAHAHERGLLVGCWTVNEQADLDRVVSIGVDYVTTDHPDRAFNVLRAAPMSGNRGWNA